MSINRIIGPVVVHQPANTCCLCQSALHMAPFCPHKLNKVNFQNASSNTKSTDVRGRVHIQSNGQKICNNFNSVQGCSRQSCRNEHACLACKKEHSQQPCKKKKKKKKKLLDSKFEPTEITARSCLVNIAQLYNEVTTHPDRRFVNFLIDGFVNGFDTWLFHLPDQPFECRNFQSTNRYPQ